MSRRQRRAAARQAPSEYPEGIARAWVCYEILRRLGFDARDIHVGIVHGTAYGTVAQVVRVELRTQDREFGYHAVIWNDSPESFEKLWDKFGDELVAGTLPDKDLRGWMMLYGPELQGMAGAISAKGIRLPIFDAEIAKAMS